MNTCHHRCSRHRISGIDFVTLRQQILAPRPDVEPLRRTERGPQVSQHEILRGLRFADSGVQFGNILQTA